MSLLLAGSFYQCWAEIDGRPPEEIVDEAISELRREQLNDVLVDIKKIFNLIEGVIDFDEIFGNEIGCNYSPVYDGKTYIEWLIELQLKLRENLECRKV
ncbi:hypothetical protein OE749_18570 [Aestuariibacter sp. AA17]|uniref:CdiI immunity protein domain-containing protein n=1 Tax=Fluctibacter corallii TaxID=2984329 RepID=A0ABT3ADE0_9ALTE|nr:hypothetical protein [Aestuariibacter sp. AA17]MCV2886695.1 hypothetical protein [Aestuariibacter sp. AA17]